MCVEVNSENLLLNYFATHDKSRISFYTLKQIKKEIETEISNNIYIDISKDSIITATLNYSDILKLTDDFIICNNFNAVHNSAFIQKSNRILPFNVKDKYLNLVKAVN